MKRAPPRRYPPALGNYAGLWVALDRDQERIIASGRTFGECRRAAAVAGQFAVILARVAPTGSRPGDVPHYLEQVCI